MTSNCATKSCMRRYAGFNLMETAIVLAVVGIVLAGLWGLVGSVRENARQDETVSQMVQTVANIRDVYKNLAVTGPGDLTSFLVEKNAILPEMIRSRTAPFTAGHLWDDGGAGGTFFVRSAVNVTDYSNLFRIELNTLPQEACIGLVGKLTGTGGPTGLISTGINASAAVGGPISPENAVVGCNLLATNTLVFTYRLRE